MKKHDVIDVEAEEVVESDSVTIPGAAPKTRLPISDADKDALINEINGVLGRYGTECNLDRFTAITVLEWCKFDQMNGLRNPKPVQWDAGV